MGGGGGSMQHQRRIQQHWQLYLQRKEHDWERLHGAPLLAQGAGAAGVQAAAPGARCGCNRVC